MDGRGTPDGNNLEAVSTLKGSHRDKFHLGATFHPRWRRLPFSEQSQPAQPASLVYHRRHIAGGRVVGETLSLSKEKEEERETPRRRGRNAITAALNLFEVHCATGGGVNGNATSSTSLSLSSLLVLLPAALPPFARPLRAEDRHNATGEGMRGWLENNRRADLFPLFFLSTEEGRRKSADCGE